MLLDLHMPVLDGVAVLERLAEVAAPHSYLPVLVLTGDSSQQARRRALSKGAKDFVTKPFEVDEVLLRIRNLLETKYLHREIATENVVLEQRVRERTARAGGRPPRHPGAAGGRGRIPRRRHRPAHRARGLDLRACSPAPPAWMTSRSSCSAAPRRCTIWARSASPTPFCASRAR